MIPSQEDLSIKKLFGLYLTNTSDIDTESFSAISIAYHLPFKHCAIRIIAAAKQRRYKS